MMENQAAETRKDWTAVPVYKNTGDYAREHKELNLYRESFEANRACRQAIENAIAGSFDGFYLAKDCEKPVVEAFGLERVLCVLAITLAEKEHDGRFSRGNIEWAKAYPISENPADASQIRERNVYNVVSSHSAILEGFVNRVRKLI